MELLQRENHTKSGQQTGDRSVVGVTGRLVLSQHTVTDTLDHTNLGGLLVVELAQTEGELTELLNHLRQGLAGTGTLEDVGGGSTAMQGSAEGQVLHLSGAQRETDLDTPDFTDGRDTITTDAVGGGEDDLLLTLDLVAVENPAGGVLNHIAVVGLGDLLEQGGDLGLRRGLLGGSLLLLLFGTAGEETGGNHKAQQQFIGVVGSVDQVGLTTGDDVAGANDDHVANNGTEAVDLSTELDLGDLTSLEGHLGFLLLGHQGGVGSDVGARRNGSRVTDTCISADDRLTTLARPDNSTIRERTLADLLALVDLGNLLFEQLVTLLAELHDLLALLTPS